MRIKTENVKESLEPLMLIKQVQKHPVSWKSCLKMIKANKPEPEDATHDKV